MNGNHPLYSAAVAADEAFATELVRVFGAARAADMRYQPNRWPTTDDRLHDAVKAKHNADTAWLAAMRGAA